MYETLIGVAFTPVYIGVVFVPEAVPQSVYAPLAAKPPRGIRTLYLDHADEKGALWFAVGGEHPEPVIRWLQKAPEPLGCTSMLAAVIDNGAVLPSTSGYYFRVGREGLDAAAMLWLLKRHEFTVYLTHSDEFLVFVESLDQWTAVSRVLEGRPGPAIRVALRSDVPSGEVGSTVRSAKKYDPIEAQVDEVMGAVTAEARLAAKDLVRHWRKCGLPLPTDISTLDAELEGEEQRIAALRQGSGSRSIVLAQVDEYAQKVRTTRRISVELALKLRDYELIPEARVTYERIATPIMLRAMERYATSLAAELEIARSFVPLIGEDFGMRTGLFTGLRLTDSAIKNKAVIVDVPAEVRLRLGALPMIARQVVRAMTDDIDRIARTLQSLHKRKDSLVMEIIPPTPEAPGSARDWERIDQGVLAFARSIAADLLATAAAGPQFVFALSRFAVGSLSEPNSPAGPHVAPNFRTRIAVCLSLLRQLGIDPMFESVYLLDSQTEVPPEIVQMIKAIVPHADRQDEEEIERVTRALTAGEVIRARPRAILDVLWRAVARRSAYVNELAALVSVAAASPERI